MTAIPVDPSEGHICYKKNCFNQAIAKILTSYVCRDHLVPDRQLKLIPETANGKEGTAVEREGKAHAQGDAGERTDRNQGTGGSLFQEHGHGSEQAAQLVGPQLPAQAGSPKSGQASGPGAVFE